MKRKTHYTCQSCGFQTARWLGRCSGCGQWNTLVEERSQEVDARGSLAELREDFRVERSKEKGSETLRWERLDEGKENTKSEPRISTGISELDRVLGGGLVPDSFVLLGGDPGIGKSTLFLQLALSLSFSRDQPIKILYVSGEESTEQIRSRAKRIRTDLNSEHFFLAGETRIEKVFSMIKEIRPQVLVMDSLQTFTSGTLESAPGSISQVREVSARLMTLAKTAHIAVLLVGHVNKEGSIAGPKVVEHLVDTVLYFEGDGGQNYRLLRTVKNRFGSTRELGVFEMQSDGLQEVKNPSSLFLNEHHRSVSGTAIAATMEGTRPLLIELQALVSTSPLAIPRRTSVGMDSNRIALIAAILERHMKTSLAQKDLFFNVAGGFRLNEPACDLAAAVSIWSSLRDHPLPLDWVFIGELGLTGEVRRVSLVEARLEEAKKLGFQTAVVSRGMMDRCKQIKGIRLIAVSEISDLAGILS